MLEVAENSPGMTHGQEELTPKSTEETKRVRKAEEIRFSLDSSVQRDRGNARNGQREMGVQNGAYRVSFVCPTWPEYRTLCAEFHSHKLDAGNARRTSQDAHRSRTWWYAVSMPDIAQ
eukprot:1391947-Rhodomonas_salina.4